MKLYLKNNLYWLIPFPLLVNFIYNLYSSSNYLSTINVSLYEITSLILAVSLFIFVGFLISDTLNLKSISLGFVYFICSFFIFDNIFLFLNKNLSFSSSFYFVLTIWVFVFLLYKKYKETSVLIIFYLLQQILNKQLITKLFLNLNINGDVEAVWYPTVKNIYENNYFFSLINSPEQGYGQLIPHIQASTYKALFNIEIYNFALPTSRLFFIMTIVFLYELGLKPKSKIMLMVTYAVLVLNNTFWSYLFLDSLMAEAISSYLFIVLTTYIYKYAVKNKFHEKLNLYGLFFVYGFLYLSKQFFSLFVLLVVLYSLFFTDHFKKSIWGLLCIFLNLLNYNTLLDDVRLDSHLSQIDLVDTIFDLILFRDLKLLNLQTISENIFVDKPLTYTLAVFFSFIIYKILLKQTIDEWFLNPMLIFSILNFTFIILLYISAWREMEMESPVRFIVAFILLKLIFIFREIDELSENQN